MACARCDFYLPKPSGEAQLPEAKDGLQQMLVQIPLTEDERAAVDVAAPLRRLLPTLSMHPLSCASTHVYATYTLHRTVQLCAQQRAAQRSRDA